MIALSVNLNKIALIRNSRDTRIPDVPEHARQCIEAGADGFGIGSNVYKPGMTAQEVGSKAKAFVTAFDAVSG